MISALQALPLWNVEIITVKEKQAPERCTKCTKYHYAMVLCFRVINSPLVLNDQSKLLAFCWYFLSRLQRYHDTSVSKKVRWKSGSEYSKDKDKDKDLFIGPQEFVVGYSKAPEQPQSSARPICHSHAMTRTGLEPASMRIAA